MLITHLSPLFLKLTESHSLTAGVALDLSRLRYLASLAAAFLPSLHRKQKQTEPVSGPSGGGRCRLFASAVNASFAVSWSLGRSESELCEGEREIRKKNGNGRLFTGIHLPPQIEASENKDLFFQSLSSRACLRHFPPQRH
ncbi:uncharacterized protein LOC107613247 isoform X3 [Arachis ipaensis]|uniref:uncharacterized protein LOC107613247 isoform X3 n=1 Tax=Arachis ipaensis TaxID=130454 RepID=UPI0007AEFA47|nr:uncharacterized protein LOC107613247 isoform X3 [Arachis ipaensis]